jgi:hypothetical protein
VFDWPSGKLQVEGLDARVAAVTMLDGGKALPFTQQAGRLEIELPGSAPDPVATVLAVKLK